MGDRNATILHLLAASVRLGEGPVGRTVLVKQTYLVEMLRPLYELYTSAYKFVRYRYGPYSKDIFRRLDQLVFHGLAEVVEFNIVEGKVKATYASTDSGLRLANKISCEPEGELLASLCNDVIWSLQCLGIRSYRDIIRLVYNEPAYEQVNRQAIQQGIPDSEAVPLPKVHSEQHPSFRLQSVFSAIHAYRKAELPSPREIVRRYLYYLAIADLPLRMSRR